MMVMDNSKRNPSTAHSKNPVADFKESSMGFWEQVNKETNENEGLPPSRRLLSPVPKKKILAERNVLVDDDAPPPPFLAVETTTTTPKVQGTKLVPSSPGPCRSSFSSVAAAAYDPVTNFTSPRPEFLRYNPNRRREILQRMEVGDMKNFDEGGSSSSSSDQAGNEEESASFIESSASPPPDQKPSSQEEEDGSDYEVDDIAMEEDEEVEERPCRSRLRMVWKLLLIFGLFFISCHYLFPTTTSSSTAPPFRRQQQEGNGGSEEITIPQRPTNWLYRDHLLTTHMGVSDVCLSAAEMMCPIDGHTRSSLVVAEEIHPIGSPAIREELGVIVDDLVMSDEVTGMVHSQVEDSRLGDHMTLVAMEERVEYLSTSNAALFEQEDDGQRGECEQVEENFEAIQRNNDMHLKSEKVEASPSSCPLQSEDTQVEKSVHLNELLKETTHSTPARNAPQVVDQATEEYRVISLLAAAAAAAALVGFLSCFLLKYLLKSMPPPPPSSAPALLPCSKSSIDEKETDAPSAAVVMEEMRNEEEKIRMKAAAAVEEDIDEDYRVNHLSLDRLREKYARRRQPTLQLLGEFSLAAAAAAEPTESEIGGGHQTFKRIEPKASQLSESESEREEGSEEPHSTRQYKMRRSSTRKSPSSSSNKLHPSSYSTESTLEGSFRPPAGKKLRKTQDSSSNKSEEKMVTLLTPLRRSDRLRKRGDSPP